MGPRVWWRSGHAAQRPGAVDAAFTGPVSWPPPETRPAGGNNGREKSSEPVDRTRGARRPCLPPGDFGSARSVFEGTGEDRRAQRAHRSLAVNGSEVNEGIK